MSILRWKSMTSCYPRNVCVIRNITVSLPSMRGQLSPVWATIALQEWRVDSMSLRVLNVYWCFNLSKTNGFNLWIEVYDLLFAAGMCVWSATVSLSTKCRLSSSVWAILSKNSGWIRCLNTHWLSIDALIYLGQTGSTFVEGLWLHICPRLEFNNWNQCLVSFNVSIVFVTSTIYIAAAVNAAVDADAVRACNGLGFDSFRRLTLLMWSSGSGRIKNCSNPL